MSLKFFSIFAVSIIVVASFASAASWTENWMTTLRPIIESYSLIDLSMPATHDAEASLRYLSTTFADNANDLPTWLSDLLHEINPVIKLIDHDAIGKFIRKNAMTQGLDFVQQLNSGIRFIDFRVDWTAAADAPSTSEHDWYLMHMVQSTNRAITALQEIKVWLDDHPGEVIILWLSHHGHNCDDGKQHYHLKNRDTFLQWWRDEVLRLFGTLVYNHEQQGNLNGTSIGEMLTADTRVVFYVEGWKNFTASSPFARSSCLIDNGGTGDDTAQAAVTQSIQMLKKAPQRMAQDRSKNMFQLSSMSGPTQTKSLLLNAELEFLAPFHLVNRTKVIAECAALFKVPNCTTWCPSRLQEKGQWANYYHQLVLDWALQSQKKEIAAKKSPLSVRIPFIYIDAVDCEGTIRTSHEVFFPQNYTETCQPIGAQSASKKYAFVAAMLLASTNTICSQSIRPVKGRGPTASQCANATSFLEGKYNLFPMQRWTDLAHGRLADFPVVPPPV